MHGTLLSFTMGNTYDAYVHIFFGSHYAAGWFETWNYKWYTGFTMTSYPPLVHQVIAILSKVVGLKLAFLMWAMVAVGLFIRGVFHFSQLWVTPIAAGYACLLATLSSSYLEAVHIFGQLPSISGMALLLNACPELYRWIRFNRWSYYITGVSLIACLTAAHHVTTIFGMVFFIAPVLGVAVLDICIDERSGIENVRVMDFVKKVLRLSPKAILIGLTVITITVVMIFPYWYWSKTDPITQVSIPHGSRASFIEDPGLGMVFFLIPWGIMLFFLPGIFHKIFQKRNLFLGLSFALLFLLGTGGTTPLPKLILGANAFNILTLDRFTFWGSIIALPFFGQFMWSLAEGRLAAWVKWHLGAAIHMVTVLFIVVMMLFVAGLIINFSNMKPTQPTSIEMTPIASFLDRDGHDRWRFMTLGFGDQMAWLSANTSALSVDGNYHSARRLPELTTRPVERIENSKYLGEEGLEALRDFLSLPEKYNLKYIFSNDKFYEPLLYFYGWKKLKPLENGIDLWERQDVPPLPTILPKKDIPDIQRIMWGTLPIGSLLTAILLNTSLWFVRREDRKNLVALIPTYSSGKVARIVFVLWFLAVAAWVVLQGYNIQKAKNLHQDPVELVHTYFHAIDFKKFEEAYTYHDLSGGLTLEQYTLELSLEDGILASYAKLDTLIIKEVKQISDNKVKIDVKANWFTAVQKYSTEHTFDLNKKDEKWYIIKPEYEAATPPDQIINIPDINYYTQGRRKAEAGATFREDVLDRPELYVPAANLIKSDSTYHVVGIVTNIDNDPSFITIEAVLYDELGNTLYRANADEVLIHNLLPKESSGFRIDFDNWSILPDSIDREDVASFVVFARTSVTDEKFYKFMGLRELEVQDQQLHGRLDNYGNKEISIPQILALQYENDNLKWVKTHYMDKGIRPQREKPFEMELKNLKNLCLIEKGNNKNILINGSERQESAKLLPRNFFRQKNKALSTDEGIIILQTNGLVSF